MKRSEKGRTPTENPTPPSSGPAGATPGPHPLVPELSGREGSRPAAAGWGALSHKVTPRGPPGAAQEDRNPLGHRGGLVPPDSSSPCLPPTSTHPPPLISLVPKLDFLGAKRLWFTY